MGPPTILQYREGNSKRQWAADVVCGTLRNVQHNSRDHVFALSPCMYTFNCRYNQEKPCLEIRYNFERERIRKTIQKVWSRHISKVNTDFVHNCPICAIYAMIDSISISHHNEPFPKWICRQQLILIVSIQTVNSWHSFGYSLSQLLL